MPFRLVHLLPAVAVVTFFPAAPAQMDQAPPQCSAAVDLPAPLASWRSPVSLKGGTDHKGAAQAVMMPGHAVIMALTRTPAIAYPVRPAKPGGTVSYGGLASFNVGQAGTWRVALGSGAWVDVVKDGRAAVSVAHGHGPDCSGIRKMVDYDLKPGRYTLQIAANGEDRLIMLVTRLP